MPEEISYTLVVVAIIFILLKFISEFVYTDKEKNALKNRVSFAILDSNNLFKRALTMGLVQHGLESRFEASNAQEMIDLLKIKGNPDIILISTRLEGVSGVETVRLLQKADPSIKILALYLDPLRERPEKMVEAGANGCISKTDFPEDIKAAILETLRTGSYKSQKKDTYRILNTF